MIPGIHKIPSVANTILERIGNTPLQRIHSERIPPGSAAFYAKLETYNIWGMKDRAAKSMILHAHERGEVANGVTVVETSSGTLAMGETFIARKLGLRNIIVTDPGMEPMMRNLLKAHGAELEIVEESAREGGWQQARLDRLAEVCEREGLAYFPDQYRNLDNPAAYKDMAHELIAQLGRIDVLVTSVGSGGSSQGCGRTLRRYFPNLRIVAVDAVNSAIFGQQSGPRLQRGLGSSIHPANVDYAIFDEVHWVADHESAFCCRELAASVNQIDGGWSTGDVYLVGCWIAKHLPQDYVVVGIFPDGGERYALSIYDEYFCQKHNLLNRPAADEPDEIQHPEKYQVSRWTRCTNVCVPSAISKC